MKVHQHSNTKLSVEHLPTTRWLVGATCFTIGVGTLGWGIVWEPTFATLNCQRTLTLPKCELRQRALVGRVVNKTLVGVWQSTTKRHSGGRKSSASYSVILNHQAGTTKFLRSAEPNDFSASRTADQINRFIADPNQRSLSVQQEKRWSNLWILICGFVILALGVSEGCAPSVVCTLSKGTGKAVLTRRRLMQLTQTEYALDRIVTIDVEKKEANSKGRFWQQLFNQQPRYLYRAVLVMENAERSPLSDEYLNEQEVLSAVSKIEQFLPQKP
jgi:hypothetical protein